MRNLILTCLVSLIAALSASAQNAPPPANGNRLDVLLKAWEQRMSSVDDFQAKVTRADVPFITKKQTNYSGQIAFMKPNLALIDLTQVDEVKLNDADKSTFERFICDGKYFYEYLPRDKKIVWRVVPKNDLLSDSMLLTLLRGMKADDAKKRFDMKLINEDQLQATINIVPKSETDLREIKAAQLKLWINDPPKTSGLKFLPCDIWYAQPNGNTVRYLLGEMKANQKLDTKFFAARGIKDYKLEAANAPAQ